MSYIENLKVKLENCEKLYSSMLCHIGFTGLPALYKNSGMNIYWIGTELTLLGAELARNKECIDKF